MVGIPTPLERGCGRFSYARLDCSYVGHREDSHPMCEVLIVELDYLPDSEFFVFNLVYTP
jgi:hypothetical protein